MTRNCVRFDDQTRGHLTGIAWPKRPPPERSTFHRTHDTRPHPDNILKKEEEERDFREFIRSLHSGFRTKTTDGEKYAIRVFIFNEVALMNIYPENIQTSGFFIVNKKKHSIFPRG